MRPGKRSGAPNYLCDNGPRPWHKTIFPPKEEAERYRTALLPRARRAYELYLDKYRNMAQAYPQVIVSQRTLFELEVHYIDSLDRIWQNAIALQNFTLQGGLERLPAEPR